MAGRDRPAAGRWLQRQIVPVEGGAVATVRDITERKLAEERIRHLAHHDELTGLPNRSLIRDRLDQAVLNAQRNGKHLALAFVDLDGFKLVNDGLGHNAGDELLKVVGRRMQRLPAPQRHPGPAGRRRIRDPAAGRAGERRWRSRRCWKRSARPSPSRC
jgi:PAS domain-containing protein